MSGRERAKARACSAAAARVRFTAAKTSKQRRASANAPCTSGRNGGRPPSPIFCWKVTSWNAEHQPWKPLYMLSPVTYTLYGRPFINYICCIVFLNTFSSYFGIGGAQPRPLMYLKCCFIHVIPGRAVRPVGTNERQMTRQEKILTVLQ